MNRLFFPTLALATGITLIGCDKSSGPTESTSIPDQTNGRITIVNDEAKLAARVTVSDETIAIDTTLRKTGRTAAFSMKLTATIAPPTVGGQVLQATSVVFDGVYAYVSYNMQGNAAIGAIDVIQIKSVKNATLRSEATFTDTDVSSVFYSNNTMYLAEATSNSTFTSPAVIEAIAIKSGKLDLTNNFRRMLSSYAATSVRVAGGKVYVTTGNSGGLYTLTQNDTLTVESFMPLTDARWVDGDATHLVIAQGGTSGQLTVLNPTTGSVLNTFTVSGMTIPESKSTVRVIGGKALVAAGDGGVQLLDLASGTVVGSIPRTVVAGLDPSVTVTNAADANGPFIYISNGEAGVYVAEASQNLEDNTGTAPINLNVLGKLQFSNLQSVNHVAYDGSTLAVAAGLGGTKFVTVSF